MRSTDDQVDGLEAALRGAAAPPAHAGPRRLDRRAGCCSSSASTARRCATAPSSPPRPSRLRGVASDIRHYRDPDVPALAGAADVVVVYRVPATPQVLELIEQHAGARHARCVFDVDDLIFDPGHRGRDPRPAPAPARRGRPLARRACSATAPRWRPATRTSARPRAWSSTPAPSWASTPTCSRTASGCALGAASEVATARPRRPGPPRVGYFSGTTTHDDDWRHIEAAVVERARPPPRCRALARRPPPADRERRRPRSAIACGGCPFMPWHELPELLRDLDVNLAPLEPGSRFNDAKSAIKWLEAALVATPTIASPSAPFVDAIDAGRTGWLADSPRRVGGRARRRADRRGRRGAPSAHGRAASRAAALVPAPARPIATWRSSTACAVVSARAPAASPRGRRWPTTSRGSPRRRRSSPTRRGAAPSVPTTPLPPPPTARATGCGDKAALVQRPPAGRGPRGDGPGDGTVGAAPIHAGRDAS